MRHQRVSNKCDTKESVTKPTRAPNVCAQRVSNKGNTRTKESVTKATYVLKESVRKATCAQSKPGKELEPMERVSNKRVSKKGDTRTTFVTDSLITYEHCA